MSPKVAGNRDSGTGTAEYAALVVLAVIIIGSLVVAGLGTKIGDNVRAEICQVVRQIKKDLKCDEPPRADGKNKIDTKPQWCVSSMHSEEAGSGWSWLVFNIGEGYKMIRYDTREEDMDGKVKHYVYLSFVNKGDLGIDIGKAGDKKKIDLGGGLTVNYGDTYRLTPKQADDLTDKINEYQAEKLSERHNPYSYFGHWIYHKVKGEDWPPNIPDPAITFSEHTEHGSGTGKVPTNVDKKLKAPKKYLMPNGVTVSSEHGHTVTTEHWYIYKDAQGHTLPATATYHTTSGSYTLKGGREGSKKGKKGSVSGGVDAGITYDYTNTTRVTRDDKSGNLKNIRYVVTYGEDGSIDRGFGATGKNRGKGKKKAGGGYSDTHSSGKLHTEVVQINFTNAQERQKGEDWLKNHGLEMPPAVADQIFPKTGRKPGVPDFKATAGKPGPDADPFDKLIYNKAMAWKTDADTKKEAKELNATLPFGRGVGIDFNMSKEDHKTKDAYILDAPKGGERQWISYPDCTAAGNK